MHANVTHIVTELVIHKNKADLGTRRFRTSDCENKMDNDVGKPRYRQRTSNWSSTPTSSINNHIIYRNLLHSKLHA